MFKSNIHYERPCTFDAMRHGIAAVGGRLFYMLNERLLEKRGTQFASERSEITLQNGPDPRLARG